MVTIVGIAGSLKRSSLNAALLRAAAEVAAEGSRVDIASIAEIPLYNGDVESVGIPDAVTKVKDKIAAATALLMVTPEYNHSMPGVFKNAIDWLSRPPKDVARVFRGKSVAIMGASPGAAGTRMSQAAWLPVLGALGMNLWCGKQLFVGNADSAFDASVKLIDDDTRKRLTTFMAEFAATLTMR